MTTHSELIERLNTMLVFVRDLQGGSDNSLVKNARTCANECIEIVAEIRSTLTSTIAGLEVEEGVTTEAMFWQDESHRKNGVIREMATYSQQLLSERGEDELVNDLCSKIYQLARGEHATD